MHKKGKKRPVSRLELDDYNFNWNASTSLYEQKDDRSDESSSEDDTVPQKKIKMTKTQKLEQERLNELKLRKAEDELLNLENPASADQFDRLLLGSPNDSALWIKYMSFHLQATEFEKVRGIAKRALQTINSKLEQEKLNIWVALLNFENLYGTKETLENCLEEAVRMNDDYQVYSKMIDIYANSNKTQELDRLINKVIKKFKESLECWLHCCSCLFQVGESSKARLLFKRALNSLTKKESLTFVSRFALLENKHGFTEEAQTLFEHIVTSYPARTDLWSCYVDMLVKSNLIQIARQVLERARIQKLPPKRMKSLFMKSIAFEEKYGNSETTLAIKKAAERYVTNYS